MPSKAQRRLGISLTWAMLVAGVASSLAIGAVWKNETSGATTKDFSSRASLVGATVVDGITRMDDFTIGARAKIVTALSRPAASAGSPRPRC